MQGEPRRRDERDEENDRGVSDQSSPIGCANDPKLCGPERSRRVCYCARLGGVRLQFVDMAREFTGEHGETRLIGDEVELALQCAGCKTNGHDRIKVRDGIRTCTESNAKTFTGQTRQLEDPIEALRIELIQWLVGPGSDVIAQIGEVVSAQPQTLDRSGDWMRVIAAPMRGLDGNGRLESRVVGVTSCLDEIDRQVEVAAVGAQDCRHHELVA